MFHITNLPHSAHFALFSVLICFVFCLVGVWFPNDISHEKFPDLLNTVKEKGLCNLQNSKTGGISVPLMDRGCSYNEGKIVPG